MSTGAPSKERPNGGPTKMPGRKTAVYFLLGLMCGIVVSPVMWMTLQNPTTLVTQCNNVEVPQSRTLRLSSKEQEQDLNKEAEREKVAFNDSSHKPKEFNLTWVEDVVPPNSPSVRYSKLSLEFAPRKSLFVGVVTAKKYLHTRALGIWNTWGRGSEPFDLKYFSAPSDLLNVSLPIVTLPDVNDSVYPPQKKVYRMLYYMYKNHLNEYDFFMRSDDDIYVRMDLLLNLLATMNPAQDIYMGSPGFGRDEDRKRIKLREDEHYCMGGPGVFFSRSALRKLGPHLDKCLKAVVVSYNEDVEVGRCVSQMVNLQCTWAWETKTLFWTDYDQVTKSSELYKSAAVLLAITIHPIKDPRIMLRVHQYFEEVRLRKVMSSAYKVQLGIDSVTKLLPQNLTHFKPRKRWIWYEILTNPSSRYELSTWRYLNSTHLFHPQEHLPIVALPSSLEKGINRALEVLVQIMNSAGARKNVYVPPYHLYEGFVLMEYSSGVQYNLHLSVHKKNRKNPDPLEFVANVFLPFHGAGMATYHEKYRVSRKTVHLIVNAAPTANLEGFLEMYRTVCILDDQVRSHLHVSLFGGKAKAMQQVADLVSKYPRALITSYDLSGSSFSHSIGYQHVVKNLLDSDIVVLMDHNLMFSKEFIWHVQMNVVRGLQVYMPIFFSYYKPDLVARYLRKNAPTEDVTADTGFFLRYNYQVVGIYRSDYEVVRKMTAKNKGGGARNDDIRFVEKLISSDLYVMRALEPYLRRRYQSRTCKSLTGHQKQVCENSKADAIGSKRMLASLLIDHNLLDTG